MLLIYSQTQTTQAYQQHTVKAIKTTKRKSTQHLNNHQKQNNSKLFQ